MSPKSNETVVQQGTYVVPDYTVKELLDVVPAHCHKRSAIRSGLYIVNDLVFIGAFWYGAKYLDALVIDEVVTFPHPALAGLARVAIWAFYSFWSGLFATGLWIIAHECGHQAFSESKSINNAVGWVLHSAVGVPYHSWRITHAKHHASTGHMTQDQVFVPHTRSSIGLPPIDTTKNDLLGSRVVDEVKKELWEAIGDSPMGATYGAATYLLAGWPAYLLKNSSGQERYPAGTNHFDPNAIMFKPHQYNDVIWSDFGIILWLTAIVGSCFAYGFPTVFRTYLATYLWVNHWLVLITFLQHTDPLLPHYRAPVHTFARGALATIDRSLLGDLGPIMGAIGAFATHGISETHILHHVASKIPHYNAWEASAALKKKLGGSLPTEGNAGGWAEVYRIYKECKFVEDEGDVVFYKNAQGLAQMRPAFIDNTASDSGIDVSMDGKL